MVRLAPVGNHGDSESVKRSERCAFAKEETLCLLRSTPAFPRTTRGTIRLIRSCGFGTSRKRGWTVVKEYADQLSTKKAVNGKGRGGNACNAARMGAAARAILRKWM